MKYQHQIRKRNQPMQKNEAWAEYESSEATIETDPALKVQDGVSSARQGNWGPESTESFRSQLRESGL